VALQTDYGTIQDAYRRQIEHEDNLIGHRISWLVASESFLFAAFALVITSANDLDSRGAVGARDALLYVVPSLGLALAVIVVSAVGAAHCRMNELCGSYRKDYERLAIQAGYPSIGPDAFVRKMGRLPARYIPMLLAFAWLSTLTVTLIFVAIGP
jgi:hypothetical protein